MPDPRDPPPRRPAADSPIGESIQDGANFSVPSGPPPLDDVNDFIEVVAEKPPVDESLLDQDIYERPAFPWGPLVNLVFAAASMLFLLQDWRFAAGVAPVWLGFAIPYSYDYFFPARFRVTADGLSSSRPRRFLPFVEIDDVLAGPKTSRGDVPLYVIFDCGILALPPRLTCDSRDLRRLLRSCIDLPKEPPETPRAFDAFLRQQRSLYPDNQIHIFRGASKSDRPNKSRGTFKLAAALLLPTPLWIALAVANPKNIAFIILSIVFGFFGVIIALFGIGERVRRASVKNADQAALIITPDGLALSQADLRGELRWSEVKKIGTSAIQSGSFHVTRPPPGLSLKVQGAEIIIADIYDWPADCIFPLIQRYSGL